METQPLFEVDLRTSGIEFSVDIVLVCSIASLQDTVSEQYYTQDTGNYMYYFLHKDVSGNHQSEISEFQATQEEVKK